MWSVTSGEKLFVAEQPFNGPATAVSWTSHNTSRFVIGFASGDLHLFCSEDRKVTKLPQAYFDLISTTLSHTMITSAYQEGKELLKALCTMQLTTRSLLSMRNRLSCGESEELSWFRFFHRHLCLKDMGNAFTFVTMGQALPCTI